MRIEDGKRKRRGFTLVEILIVVIILGVLASIAIAAFSDSSTDAQLNVCFENLRIIQQALSLYRLKVGTYPSSAAGLDGYVREDRNCPLGGSYEWTLSNDKYHIRCSAQHASGSSHTCIHEDQGPTVK